jgi:hypothetical protein
MFSFMSMLSRKNVACVRINMKKKQDLGISMYLVLHVLKQSPHCKSGEHPNDKNEQHCVPNAARWRT